MKSMNKSGLHALVLKLLKQLVRILIRHEVSHSEFNELAKQAYAEAAYKHFQLDKRKMTYARVAVLTGINRKEVVRLLDSDKQYPPKPKVTPNKVKRVVMGWITDSEFHDESGDPKPLSFKEPGSEFHSLVEKHGADISIRAVLDELHLLNLVSEQNDLLCLVNKGYVPRGADLEEVRILSDSITNLVKTGVENLETNSKEGKKFQRQLTLNINNETLLNEFKEYSSKKSQELLLEFYAWKQSQQSLDSESEDAECDVEGGDTSKPNRPITKAGIGIYYFEEE